MSWENDARRIVKVELVKRGITYKGLATRLESLGVEESERSIANKLSRGTFSFIFFLQCMKSMGARSLTLEFGELGETPKAAGPTTPLEGAE